MFEGPIDRDLTTGWSGRYRPTGWSGHCPRSETDYCRFEGYSSFDYYCCRYARWSRDCCSRFDRCRLDYCLHSVRYRHRRRGLRHDHHHHGLALPAQHQPPSGRLRLLLRTL
jgi:hypothetical protein